MAWEVVEIDLAAPVAAQPVALGLVPEGALTLAADLQTLGAGLGFEITRDLIGILRDFSAWSFGKAGR